jgi:hypothetical protein
MIIKIILSVILIALLFWGAFEGGKRMTRTWAKYLFMGTSFVLLSCAVLFVIVQLF